jgi:hypothetical protein
MPDAILPGQTSPATTPPGRPFLPLGLAALVIGPLVLGFVVVGVLIALAMRGAQTFDNYDNHRSTSAELMDLGIALKAYETDHGRFPPPPNASLVRTLQTIGQGRRPYFAFLPEQISPSGELIDAWQKPCVYKFVKATDRGVIAFRLYSLGPNGIDEDGKGDDIAVGN